jgi:hypothetical protein
MKPGQRFRRIALGQEGALPSNSRMARAQRTNACQRMY